MLLPKLDCLTKPNCMKRKSCSHDMQIVGHANAPPFTVSQTPETANPSHKGKCIVGNFVGHRAFKVIFKNSSTINNAKIVHLYNFNVVHFI